MKSFLILLGSAVLFLSSALAPDKTLTLTVIADGFKEKKGKLMVGVYNSDSTFMKKPYKGYAVDVTDTILEFSIELPEGEYAISVFHDANENNRMDIGEFGIPTEAYGFSNNAKGFRGPPSFEKSKFSLTKDSTSVRISMIHGR